MTTWDDIRALRYPGFTVDPDTWTVTMPYELIGAGRTLRFTETVTFPAPPGTPDTTDVETFRRVLALLYIAAGTSYYKVAAPPEVDLGGLPLAASALPWATALYRHGLAEFAYRNRLDHVLGLTPTGAATRPDAAVLDGGDRPPLVTVGGGKDSIVSVEALRGFAPVLFAVNPNPIITSVLAVSDRPALSARRVIDRQLFELNRNGAYNGHIPVTAINSLIAVATAALHGLGPVVMSNESSASAPNLEWHGHHVNHQWSKGFDAERLLRDALFGQAGLPDAYFSLLRPLSEVHIARMFSHHTGYDDTMTSCNQAFKLNDPTARWCADCPKCRFVFLALAPFVDRARLVHIFGSDMFLDTTQLPGYREILGLTAHKPFECVGETDESLVALRLIVERGQWADAPVVAALHAEAPWPDDAAVTAVFATDGPTLAPPAYAKALADAAD